MTAKEFIKGIPEAFGVLFGNLWTVGIVPNFKYLRYVLRHKWFVFLGCWRYALIYHEPRLIWRGIVHDFSKFRPSEWFAYTDYFYREFPSADSDFVRSAYRNNIYFRTQEDVQADFDEAWNYHQKRNDHHWQYWLLQNDDGSKKVLPMPLLCRLEMVADWQGAGRALGKPDTKAWYLANRENISLDFTTRDFVEVLLGIE